MILPAAPLVSEAFGGEILEGYQRGDGFLLPVHPDTLTCADLVDRDALLACRPGPAFEVTPTANARTVLVERVDGAPVAPHFLKLHYPRRLSRFHRRLRRPIIEVQLWGAGELLRVGAPVLPEIGGAVFGHDPESAWGFLLRSARPAGADPLSATVPLFALYGGDLHAPNDPTLFEQLVEASGRTPTEYLVERVIEPAVRLWVEVAARTGCALEPHGQNTLFAFSPDGSRSRLLYRDCGVYVVGELRRRAGLRGDLPPANVIGRDVDAVGEQVLSLTYDRFLCGHALSYLATLARRRFGVEEATLHTAARRVFASAGGAALGLPSTVYYYDGELRDGGEFRLVDTGEAPRWR